MLIDIDAKLSQSNMSQSTFKQGETATIRPSIHSPYSGRTGIVMDVDNSDTRGAYLVLFSDGLQFRYTAQEMEFPGTRHSNVVETLYRMISETRQGLRRVTHI
jgi:hypothetical protein